MHQRGCREELSGGQEAAVRLHGLVRPGRAGGDDRVRGVDRQLTCRPYAVAAVLAAVGLLPAAARAQVDVAPANRVASLVAGSLASRAVPPSSAMSLVELPTEPGVLPETAARRPRHALRMRSTAAESAVRSLGIDASECAMLFRMNTKTAAAGSSGLVLKPQ